MDPDEEYAYLQQCRDQCAEMARKLHETVFCIGEAVPMLRVVARELQREIEYRE